MENDDDFHFLLPAGEPSPSVQHRKLKRLKKAIQAPNDPLVESADEGASLPHADSFKSEVLESSESPGFKESDEPLRSQSTSEGVDVGDDLNSGFGGLEFGEDRKKTQRALDFDDMVEELDRQRPDESGELEEKMADLKVERLEKKRLNEEVSNEIREKKKKKKRIKSDGDAAKSKTSSPDRRRGKKERKTYLQQLHVESQRLLRESSDAAFKPVPVVQKPISSVLEKIRQRKLERSHLFVDVDRIAKNNDILREDVAYDSENVSSEERQVPISSVSEKIHQRKLEVLKKIAKDNDNLREDMAYDLENVSTEERQVDELIEVVQEDTVAFHANVECSLNASRMGGSKEAARQSSIENTPSQMAMDEQSTHAFRAPVDDTQDLFCDSQTSEGKSPISNDQDNSPLEEVLAPSFLAMNLKFDSAPPDDTTSSEEEDNDKENIDPDPHRFDKGCSFPKGDPVKAFVDDEAVEEDDSDNDLLRFQENEEDEDIDDHEEFNDLIATEYDERPVDNERRNELHQKWLEQQDAAGTDNLMQRLKFGSKLKDTKFLEGDEDEDDEDEEDEEFGDEAMENRVKTSMARINSRKAKQMIPDMFSDKNDDYLSSDGEETERRLVKQRLLDKAEEHVTLLSPGKDENSREVFGLIKKLNIVPDTKKKAKISSFFDKMLTGGINNGSSKSSFLGRVSSHSLPSSHKKGASTARSFVFGRDDSNSRSSISMSEDSSDAISGENRSLRNAAAKFRSSQSKISTQSTMDSAEAVSGASLFEILKRSSMQSNICNQDTMVGLTQTVFASFKIPKKPSKIEGRI
ncbi:hypothetical protein U1Q18_043320 [Sarracenia purpurea var. burkii]